LLAVRTAIPNPLEGAATLVAALLALTLFVTLPNHANAADTQTPSAVVEALHETLTEAMKQAEALGYQGRFDLIEPAASKAIDQTFMAQKSIGRHWRKLSEEERMRWVASFSELTVANYAGRFKGYAGEHFTMEGERDAPHDTKLVKTILVLPNDDDVALNYRLHLTDDGWKIIDIYMNGTVSELSLRRSEYSSTVKRDGFETLIAAIEEKLADFEAGAVGDTGSPIASSTATTQ
jgi:phospholipid transport system substrate-binding protein